MIRTYWRPVAALLAGAVAGAAVQAQEALPMPGSCVKFASCVNHAAADGKMIQKTYPIAPLLHAFGCCPSCPDLVIKFMTQCLAPETWAEHGGHGTMTFCPMNMTLVVRQTPEVHKQVSALLNAMDKMASVYGGPMSLVPVGLPVPPPMPPHPAVCPTPAVHVTHPPEPKQHFRFVIDNLRIKTDDKAMVTIKHVEVEYAGDGIDADVAKCAITLGGSEKKAEKEEGAAAAIGAAAGAMIGGATPGIEKDSEKCDKAEENSDKADVKKGQEEEDYED